MQTLLARFAPWLFVLLWSTGFIGAKLGLPYADPGVFLFTRFFITATLLVCLISVFFGPWPRDRRFYFHQMVIGILMHCLYLGGVFGGISLGLSAGLAALIVGLQPVLTALIAGLWLREVLSRQQWLGFALGFVGVALVVLDRHGLSSASMDGGGLSVALCVLALFAISIGTVYQKNFGQGAPLLAATATQYVAAAAVMGVAAPLWGSMDIVWSGEFIFAMAWLVVALSLLAIALLSYLISRGAASQVASLFYLVPPVVALEAWLLFDERLGVQAIVGLVLVMLAVRLVRKTAVPAERT